MIIQPNIFKTCTDCSCDNNCIIPYMAKLNDYFSAEIQDIYASRFMPEIIDGSFTGTPAGAWTIISASAMWSGGNPLSVTMNPGEDADFWWQSVIITAGNTITFVHSDIPAETDLRIWGYTGGAWVNIVTYSGFLAGALETITATANYTRFGFDAFYPGDETGTGTVTVDNFVLNADYIYSYKVSNFRIVDCCNDAVIDTLDTDDITYYLNDTTRALSYLEIKFRWSKYAVLGNQFKICYDRQLVVNGTFDTDLTGWTEALQTGKATGTLWSFQAGEAMTDLVTAYSKQRYQSIYFERNCEYTISVQVTGNQTVDFDFTIQTDDLSLNETENIVGNTPTTYTYTFTPDFTGYQNLSFFANTDHPQAQMEVLVDDISIITTLCSHCYSIGEHECSLLIEATNNEDAYGLYEEFFGSMRIAGKMHKIKPIHKEQIYRNTQGSTTNVFTDLALNFELETYMLDSDQFLALCLLLSFDNLLIDRVAYVKVEGGIEPNWDNKYKYVSFTCELTLKVQQFQKDFV